MIAQELKTVIPELVIGNEGNYSIDYVKMVPYLLKALQNQKQIIARQDISINEIKVKQEEANKTLSADIISLLQQLQQQVLQQQEEIIKLKDQLKENQ